MTRFCSDTGTEGPQDEEPTSCLVLAAEAAGVTFSQQQQQQCNAPRHKAWNHLKLLPWTWQRVHWNSKGLRSHQLSEIGVVDKSAATVATLFTSCRARTPRPRFLRECFSNTLLNLWHERRPKAALKVRQSKETDLKWRVCRVKTTCSNFIQPW